MAPTILRFIFCFIVFLIIYIHEIPQFLYNEFDIEEVIDAVYSRMNGIIL